MIGVDLWCSKGRHRWIHVKICNAKNLVFAKMNEHFVRQEVKANERRATRTSTEIILVLCRANHSRKNPSIGFFLLAVFVFNSQSSIPSATDAERSKRELEGLIECVPLQSRETSIWSRRVRIQSKKNVGRIWSKTNNFFSHSNSVKYVPVVRFDSILWPPS